MWKRMWKGLAAGVVLAGISLAGTAAAGRAEPASRAPDPGWRPFVSPTARFRIELPADPVVRPDQDRFTLLGPVTGEIYRVRLHDLELSIEVRDLPALAEALVPDELVLDATREGVVDDLEAEELEGGETRLAGLPARDFVYRLPGEPPAIERALAVLVGGRLYLVTGKAPRPPGESPELARFFASFRFWREGEPAPHP